VAEPAAENSIPSPGLSVEVVVAGIGFAASAGVTGLSALTAQRPPSVLLLLGWPLLAVIGGVLLDQHPRLSLGRAFVGLSLSSLIVVVWTLIRFGRPDSPDIARAYGELAALLAVGVSITVPWVFQAPAPRPVALASTVLAGVGATVVTVGRVEDSTAVVITGWSLAAVGVGGAWALVLRATRDVDRTARRRLGWVLATLSLGGVATATTWILWPGRPGYYATCGALMMGALAVASVSTTSDFRPLDEHLLDLGLLLAVVVTAAITAGLVRLGSELAHRPSPGTTTVFTALLTAAMATPAAFWVRRTLLARRYGSGLIAPEDVAAITADLHAKTEPRDLLDKAARIVATASGSREARIVLGDDDPSAPEQWAVHPLEVGGDHVGTLLIESADAEGPEVRQQKVVAQLLPTVALVARAVGLAVEAEHARKDVARERDAERKRVMGDLHDGLGPVLAGMSMRVQAALRTASTTEYAGLLGDLARDLSASRTDLRRIVAGITPSTLADGDLDAALRGLVESFRGATETPKVGLTIGLDEPVGPEVQVAVYRSVAEGITNGLRHASAATIDVAVRTRRGRVFVEVSDDGVGGPVVPGVGLSSLARRAESLGGTMTICPGDPGTSLHLDLPAGATS
jgi:signal transduction histidine kinase